MPTVAQKAYDAWMKIVRVLGTINGYFIFGLIYIVVIGLYAIPVRILSLAQRKQHKKESYWLPAEEEPQTLADVQRLF